MVINGHAKGISYQAMINSKSLNSFFEEEDPEESKQEEEE